MQRRTFLSTAMLAGVGGSFARADDTAGKPYRAAVIGHTGRGNYGHGLDVVWQQVSNTELVAVADANPVGLAKEMKKLGIDRGYQHYEEMLREIRPQFVSVAPRHVDQHHDMALAAIETGVKGIYVEKPFCRTPAEADSLIAAAEKHGASIAVAHRNRYHPALASVEQLIADGHLGRLIEIRGRGLGDRRGGGEDLWVLGCHIMNLFVHFAGPPQSCSAVMRQRGELVTRKHVMPGAEGLGPLAADEVHARYEMKSGVVAYYDSIANDGTKKNGYCLHLIGSEAMIAIHIDRNPLAHLRAGNPFDISDKPESWIPITSAGLGRKEPDPQRVDNVQNHVAAVEDLIDAVASDRPPLCDVHAGASTVEMICAVFESHRNHGQAVTFPLRERGNALTRL